MAMNGSRKEWLLPLLIVALGVIAAAVIVFFTVVNGDKLTAAYSKIPSQPSTVANQDVDPGTPAGDIPAPNFELRDQLGRATSLAQFRGKVVLIAFVDSQCTTICPLTTQSMVEALQLLGPSAADVQLLGINANPLALKVSDVAAYTHAHDMQGRWRFLTGSLPQLRKVWREYNVYVAAIHNDIDHQPAMVLIDTRGRESRVYMTQMSYEGVSQQAQILADDIADVLPGPAAVAQKTSLNYVAPLQPAVTTNFPSIGAHQEMVALGGSHARLLVFFATWLEPEFRLAAKLVTLDRYAADAKRNGWPAPVVIDESPTEASPQIAQALLQKLALGLRTPAIQDPSGRLGDGYQVQDLPWYCLTSPSGKIIWNHDGWLSRVALDQQVSAALSKNRAVQRAAALAHSAASASHTKTPALD